MEEYMLEDERMEEERKVCHAKNWKKDSMGCRKITCQYFDYCFSGRTFEGGDLSGYAERHPFLKTDKAGYLISKEK